MKSKDNTSEIKCSAGIRKEYFDEIVLSRLTGNETETHS